MTAKEKAKHLVEMYVGLSSNKLSDYSRIEYPTAKQCALLSVEELIKETGAKYWYDVKRELEKL